MMKLLTTAALASTLLLAGTASAAGGQAVLAINEKLTSVYGNLGGQFRESYAEDSFISLLQGIDERYEVRAEDYMALTLTTDEDGNIFITEQIHQGAILQEGLEDFQINTRVENFVNDVDEDLFGIGGRDLDYVLDAGGLAGDAITNVVYSLDDANDRLIAGEDRATVVEEFYAEANPQLGAFNAANQVLTEVTNATSDFVLGDASAWDLNLELYNRNNDIIRFGNRAQDPAISVNEGDHNAVYRNFLRSITAEQYAFACEVNPENAGCYEDR